MDGEGVKRSIRWIDRSPNETDVLAYMSFPRAHHAKIHSVNPLERLNGELERRTDVVGFDGAPRTPLTP